jgi:hypothetical protein
MNSQKSTAESASAISSKTLAFRDHGLDDGGEGEAEYQRREDFQAVTSHVEGVKEGFAEMHGSA